MFWRDSHPRFDFRLKRILRNSDYERIRTAEPCIVDSSLDKKVFQFVAVDSEGIMVEKWLPELVVHFADVLSVELKSDKPKFLKGREQDEAQHVVIRYTTNSRLPRIVEKELNLRIKMADSNLKNEVKKMKKENKRDRKKVKEIQKSDSGKTPLENAETVGKEVDDSREDATDSTTPLIGKDNSPKPQNDGRQEETPGENEEPDSPATEDTYLLTNLPAMPSTHRGALSVTSKHGESRVGEASARRPMVAEVRTVGKTKAVEFAFETNGREIFISDRSDGIADRDGVLPERSYSDATNGKDSAEFDNGTLTRFQVPNRSYLKEEVLNLYLLNDTSSFFAILKRAWVNFKLRKTSEIDHPDYKLFDTVPNYRQVVELQFKEDKIDLLSKLCKEADNITRDLKRFKQNIDIHLPYRRLFWKDARLVLSLVRFLVRSRIDEFADKIKKDGSNFVPAILSAMEILTLSFRETEISRGRVDHVTFEVGCEIVRVVCLELEFEREGNTKEVLDFMVDFTRASIDLLFQLFNASSVHPYGQSEDLNPDRLVRFAVSRPHFNNFLGRTMSLLVSMAGGQSEEKLSPPCALFVFSSLYVLDVLTERHRDVTERIVEKYGIDLRYSIDLNSFGNKCPGRLQITADMRTVSKRLQERMLLEQKNSENMIK